MIRPSTWLRFHFEYSGDCAPRQISCRYGRTLSPCSWKPLGGTVVVKHIPYGMPRDLLFSSAFPSRVSTLSTPTMRWPRGCSIPRITSIPMTGCSLPRPTPMLTPETLMVYFSPIRDQTVEASPIGEVDLDFGAFVVARKMLSVLIVFPLSVEHSVGPSLAISTPI